MKKNGFLRKHPVVLHLLLTLAASVLIVVLVFVFIKIYSRHGQEFVMEDYAGQNYSEVLSTNPHDLRFVITDSIYNNDNMPGTILTQDPPAGAMIKKGRQVYLTIAASEPEDIIMPDLVDMSLRQAVSQLMSDGLLIGRLDFVESEDRNAIKSQSIRGRRVLAGQKVSRGSVVDLSVGRGTSMAGTVVPVLIGKNRENAQRAVFSSSLNISEIFTQSVTNKSTAMVYKQDPVCSDEKYPLGATVSVWYCPADEYEAKRRAADREIDSLKRVADSLRRALEMDDAGSTDVLDFFDFDDIW